MNICIVNDTFKMGGVERVSSQLANTLQEKGHQITLIDFSGENIFFYQTDIGVNRPDAIKPRNLKRKLISKIKYNRYVCKDEINISEMYKEQIDDLVNFLMMNSMDVLIMNQGTLTAIIPEIKKELKEIKIVAWQHNEYEKYINSYYKRFVNRYLLGIQQSDLVICLTEFDQKKFKEFNRNSYFIYNPLTIANRNRRSDLNSKNIIFVGRLEIEQKGLDFLIYIANNMPKDWKIIVAGDGSDKEKFLGMIKRGNLENQILLKGSLNTEELAELYLSGSILISTSRWEGFGLVITEAMSFGLPVVAFANSGPIEILNYGQYGILIEKEDIENFSVKINELIDNPLKREHYQQKSLERVKDFELDKIISKWIEKLENI